MQVGKDVLELRKKISLYFDVNEFLCLPQDSEEEKYWLLSGGRRGHVGVWQYTKSDGNFLLQYGKELLPPGDTAIEVVVKFLLAPTGWSCWDPATIKEGNVEIFVLLVGRRNMYQGCSLYSLQLDLKKGKLRVDSKKHYHLNGECAKASGMTFWNGYLVLGMGQQLAFIGQFTEERDSIIDWYFECPSDICSICSLSGNDGMKDKFLIVGGMDKKIRWYVANEGDNQSLLKVQSIKAHSSRISYLMAHGRTIISGGGDSDPSVKMWKAVDDCSVGEDHKRDPGLLKTWEGHTGAIKSMSILGDYLITGSSKQDATLRVWNLSGNDSKSIQARITDHKAVHAMHVVDNSTIITAGNGGDRKLCVWSTKPLTSCSITTNKCIIQ